MLVLVTQLDRSRGGKTPAPESMRQGPHVVTGSSKIRFEDLDKRLEWLKLCGLQMQTKL